MHFDQDTTSHSIQQALIQSRVETSSLDKQEQIEFGD